MKAVGLPAEFSPRVDSPQPPIGFALRILENGAVMSGIGHLGVISRAMEAQDADSRAHETGLSRKELDEVVTEANQGPLGTDLDHATQ
jgi:hypothetical protein